MNTATFLSRTRQRGLSLVDMLVGIAIGLFIIAAATLVVSSQLTENRRLLLETQVQQDLRATADIITRDIRRSGYSVTAIDHIWLPDRPASGPSANQNSQLDLTTASQPDYRYNRADQSRFSLALDGGTIYRKIDNNPRQPLTDRNTLKIQDAGFSVTQQVVDTLPLACPRLCADGTQSCWPTVEVRDLVITLIGEAVSDPKVVRRIDSRIRVRNDAIAFNAPGAQVCP